MDTPVMRILFITSGRIGDAVLSTGLLDHLIRIYPKARITVACGPVAQDVFARMPNLDCVIPMEKRRFGLHWIHLWCLTVGTLWDLVVDIRMSGLSYLVPTRRRAVQRRRTGHKTEELASILRLDPPPLPVVWTGPHDVQKARTLLPPGSPIIALGPTANWSGKIWPADRFAELFRRLSVSLLPGARLAVFGGPGAVERAIAAPLLAAIPTATDLCGTLTLPEAAACLGRCALFVGNDSGLMHIAAASGIPTLGLFGPTPAAEYAPAGRRTAVALSSTSRMEDLSIDAAILAAAGLLAQTWAG